MYATDKDRGEYLVKYSQKLAALPSDRAFVKKVINIYRACFREEGERLIANYRANTMKPVGDSHTLDEYVDDPDKFIKIISEADEFGNELSDIQNFVFSYDDSNEE